MFLDRLTHKKQVQVTDIGFLGGEMHTAKDAGFKNEETFDNN